MVTPPHHRQGSDRGYHSRPHSRSHSSLGNGMSASYRSESPDAVLVQYSPPRPNSVPMPAGEGQTEGEEATEGQESDLVPDPRLSMVSFTSSTGDSAEQTEALRKALAEMTRRAAEQERSLQEQLGARELDIEDIQAQLENTRDLISMLKKDEKEWRSKEVSANDVACAAYAHPAQRHYVTQINGLEADVNKLQRNLDNARAQHHTLTKQYSEQCAEADKYRNQVRMRDGDIRELEHRLATVEHEVDKVRCLQGRRANKC
jgi:septal ring factor EnvC (AmiA/AmiB activator)